MKISPINFFTNHTNYNKEDILKIKKIHHGFTNESYFLKTKDKKKWQLRFAGLNEVVIRENEIEVLKLINNKYHFYDENGNSIREWIKGKKISLIFNKRLKLKLICDEINKLHSFDIKNSDIIVNDYLIYINKTINLSNKLKKKYIELVDKYKNLDKVISHNDLSPANIIYSRKKVIFIDYEWSRINDNYFDIANFIREANLNLKWLDFLVENLNNVNIEILKDYLFIVTCFAYQWTFFAKQDKKTLKYRSLCFKKMHYFFNKINYNNS